MSLLQVNIPSSSSLAPEQRRLHSWSIFVASTGLCHPCPHAGDPKAGHSSTGGVSWEWSEGGESPPILISLSRIPFFPLSRSPSVIFQIPQSHLQKIEWWRAKPTAEFSALGENQIWNNKYILYPPSKTLLVTNAHRLIVLIFVMEERWLDTWHYFGPLLMKLHLCVWEKRLYITLITQIRKGLNCPRTFYLLHRCCLWIWTWLNKHRNVIFFLFWITNVLCGGEGAELLSWPANGNGDWWRLVNPEIQWRAAWKTAKETIMESWNGLGRKVLKSPISVLKVLKVQFWPWKVQFQTPAMPRDTSHIQPGLEISHWITKWSLAQSCPQRSIPGTSVCDGFFQTDLWTWEPWVCFSRCLKRDLEN